MIGKTKTIVDYFISSGGDLTYTGTLTCGNDGNNYTADSDWIVVDFPCASEARFVLDWSTSSDLDFYVWGSAGESLIENATAESGGPISTESFAGGRLYFLFSCWEAHKHSLYVHSGLGSI